MSTHQRWVSCLLSRFRRDPRGLSEGYADRVRISVWETSYIPRVGTRDDTSEFPIP